MGRRGARAWRRRRRRRLPELDSRRGGCSGLGRRAPPLGAARAPSAGRRHLRGRLRWQRWKWVKFDGLAAGNTRAPAQQLAYLLVVLAADLPAE